MSTADLIYEKSKSLPERLQSEALSFVKYLERRGEAQTEVRQWERLLRETQNLSSAQQITENDIAAEIAAYRNGK